MDILTQMMRLPFSMVAMSLEPFLQMARDADGYSPHERRSGGLMPRPIELPLAPAAPLVPAATPFPSPSPTAQTTASLASVIAGKNGRRDEMNDNMIKVLQYWIVWTKPDEECVLAHGEKVVSYPSNEGSIASQILLGWAKDCEKDPRYGSRLKNRRDWRYLKVKAEMVERYAPEEKYYDRRQTKAQERIAESLATLGGPETSTGDWDCPSDYSCQGDSKCEGEFNG